MLARLNYPPSVEKVMLASYSKNTLLQYNCYVNRWILFCESNCINYTSPSIINVLRFLAGLLDKDVGYSVINSAKSALSNFLNPIDGCSIGTHPKVLQFMKGVAKLKPTLTKYKTTWDANKVLHYIESLSHNSELSLRQLTLKLCALLALVTAQRVQALCSIKIANILMSTPVQIKLDSVLKTTTFKNPNPVLVLPEYDECPKLCVVTCLKRYIEITSSLRKNDHLFVSFNKPHNSVAKQTIARWLVEVLKLSGIDTETYQAHSYRHAATSKAKCQGMSVDDIMKRVGWSQKSNTFAKFYNRPIDKRIDFAMNILSK